MEPKTILTLLSIFAILIGVYSIYASIKNTHKNHSQRKLKHRLIQKILGINGARFFYGILGFGFIILGVFILFQSYIKPDLGNEYNNKTDKFVLVSKTINNDGYTMKSKTHTTLEQLKSTIKIIGNEKLNEYVQVSFKNNYINKVPDIIWEMKNLNFIDLTYNNISELNIEKIIKMDSLKTIILKENPISEEKIKEIREKTNIEIKY